MPTILYKPYDISPLMDISYMQAYFVGVKGLDATSPHHNYSHIISVILASSSYILKQLILFKIF